MVRICKISFIVAFFLIFFVSCEKKDYVPAESGNPSIQFTTEISGSDTRMVNALWESGDRIGIFMKATGVPLSTSSIVDGALNKEYVTQAGGIFVPGSEPQAIRFPQDGSGVDFIAYYPYTGSLNGFLYNVDVSNQSDPAKIDLLYSANAVNVNPAHPFIPLQFGRRLTKISINISASDNVSSLSGLEVTLAGARTLAHLNLANGTLTADDASVADIHLHTTITANTAQAEAILIPDEGGAGRKVTFRLEGVGTFEWEIPQADKLERGKKYTYSITLNAEGVNVVTHGLVETPLMSNPLPDNLVYVSHAMPGDASVRNYAMLYDKENKLALWVAYPLHSYYIGDSGRTNAWAYDPKINASFQPFLTKGFGASSGLDRGHQIPSGDRTRDVATNKATFYYSNITAQNSTLNQGQWALLETQIREWTEKCDTMYVVTGAAVTSATDLTITYVPDNNGQNVAKPKYYYKALAQLEAGNYYTIAFKMDNAVPGGSYNTYRLTVKELEEVTGLTFFPSIPAANKNEIVSGKWN